jgi:hypothetical protein
MHVEPGVKVTHDGQSVTSLVLTSDGSRRPTVAQLGSFQWLVIERADRVGIRLRNTASPAITAFNGIEMFPISLDWRIPVRFDRYDPPKMIRIPNIIGTVSVQPSPGAVVFEVDGEKLRIDVTGDPDGDRFSIVFGDRTNANETYGGGRFLTVNGQFGSRLEKRSIKKWTIDWEGSELVPARETHRPSHKTESEVSAMWRRLNGIAQYASDVGLELCVQ